MATVRLSQFSERIYPFTIISNKYLQDTFNRSLSKSSNQSVSKRERKKYHKNRSRNINTIDK